ncbi:MAG TPA: carboxypeptidase-like regulatory domain-containing protein [Blastocatellia bacterium]|nr:carboxypeptidase-like regulatory domain-containing protein [Blastocatellia bacterium]
MKPVTISLLLLLCAMLARTAPGRQSPAESAPQPNREGAITGRVVGPDGRPIAEARVLAIRVNVKSGSWQSAVVADDGSFKLTPLSSGTYALLAAAPGYVPAEISIEKTIHYVGENVTLGLVKGGVITGRVTDETGEPIVGVNVTCQRLRDPDGRTTGSQIGLFDYGVGGATDDRGIYRIFGLRPGGYIVSVRSNDGAQIRPDAPTYHPSATRDTATEINLHSDEEVSGVDIRHRGDRGQIVSGSISGEPASSIRVTVTLKGGEDGRFEDRSWTTGTGGFVFHGVPEGSYELIATRGSEDGETSSSARRLVSVSGGDAGGIELKLMPHGSIAGRVVIEPSTPASRCAIEGGPAEDQASGPIQERVRHRPVVEEVLLIAARDDPDRRAQVPWRRQGEMQGRSSNEKGEFLVEQLEAGRYHLIAFLPDDGWRIRAINRSAAGTAGRSGGATAASSSVDVSRNGVTIKPGEKLFGLQVVVAEDAARLSGRIVPKQKESKLPSSLRAYLIPAEAAMADDVIRYSETDVGGDGSFDFKHLAPGKYWLHTRQVSEKETNNDDAEPVVRNAIERAKLRREAAAARNEIELKPCQRLKDYNLVR